MALLKVSSKMVRALWLPVALCATALGCSVDTADDTDVNEEKLWGRYQVHYNEGTRDLNFYAQLRLGGPTGTTIRLTEGKMEVEGQTMRAVDGDSNPINLLGTFYVLDESTATPAESYAFTWTRSDGSTHVNTIEVVDAFSISAPAAGASHTGGDLTVTLDGPPLGTGEFYVVDVDPEARAGEGERALLSERVDSGSQVVFPAAQVAELPAGTLEIRARRTHTAPPQTGHDVEGGERVSTWVAPAVRITFTPTEGG